ncbi:hypothetical protein [Streptomyces sp. NPDC020681]|uniref:hypothetical protein n=1 Tax=Streptomyces sp. NPDC020681 TaxID=3365083 RepID=UPI0037ADD3D9
MPSPSRGDRRGEGRPLRAKILAIDGDVTTDDLAVVGIEVMRILSDAPAADALALWSALLGLPANAPSPLSSPGPPIPAGRRADHLPCPPRRRLKVAPKTAPGLLTHR